MQSIELIRHSKKLIICAYNVSASNWLLLCSILCAWLPHIGLSFYFKAPLTLSMQGLYMFHPWDRSSHDVLSKGMSFEWEMRCSNACNVRISSVLQFLHISVSDVQLLQALFMRVQQNLSCPTPRAFIIDTSPPKVNHLKFSDKVFTLNSGKYYLLIILSKSICKTLGSMHNVYSFALLEFTFLWSFILFHTLIATGVNHQTCHVLQVWT